MVVEGVVPGVGLLPDVDGLLDSTQPPGGIGQAFQLGGREFDPVPSRHLTVDVGPGRAAVRVGIAAA